LSEIPLEKEPKQVYKQRMLVEGSGGGRPRVMSEKMISLARQLMSDNDNSAKDVANTVGVSRATLYRYILETRVMLKYDTILQS